MQEIWNQILNYQYINEILIGIGALLVLVGFFKIVRNGLRIILWILLTALGCFGVAYGLDRSTNPATANLSAELGSFVEPGKEFFIEKLQNVCQSLDVPFLNPELNPELNPDLTRDLNPTDP